MCNLWSSLMAILMVPLTTLAATHYVDINSPAPQYPYTSWAEAATNIQMAVDACAAGEDVLVAAGVYPVASEISVVSAVSLRSVAGPATTIIDGQGTVRCLNASLMTEGLLVVDGFTFCNGMEAMGGGVRLYGYVIMRNCYLKVNTATAGGGIYAEGAAVVSNCLMEYNTGSLGGGLYLRNGPSVRNCRIRYNTGWSHGAGVYIENTATVSHCMVSENHSYGGGVGGGVYMTAPSWIQGATLLNNVIDRNIANEGGGVYSVGSNYMAFCTVVDNYATNRGGGIAMDTSIHDFFCENSIVYYNLDAAGYPNYYTYDSAFEACCLTPLPAGSFSNISDPPSFVNYSVYDYRLAVGSPCVDAAWVGRMEVDDDLDGVRRPADGNLDGVSVNDMGAHEYEFRLKTISVNGSTANVEYDCLPYHNYKLYGTVDLSADPVNWIILENQNWGDAAPGLHTFGFDSPDPVRAFHLIGEQY